MSAFRNKRQLLIPLCTHNHPGHLVINKLRIEFFLNSYLYKYLYFFPSLYTCTNLHQDAFLVTCISNYTIIHNIMYLSLLLLLCVSGISLVESQSHRGRATARKRRARRSSSSSEDEWVPCMDEEESRQVQSKRRCSSMRGEPRIPANRSCLCCAGWADT